MNKTEADKTIFENCRYFGKGAHAIFGSMATAALAAEVEAALPRKALASTASTLSISSIASINRLIVR